MQSKLSRRALFGAVAVPVVAAASALPVAAPTIAAPAPAAVAIEPDPIFAAIEAHRQLWDEVMSAMDAFDRAPNVKAIERRYNRVSKAEEKALLALTTTRPTTIAGAGALAAYTADDMKDGGHPWQERALANVSRALLGMHNDSLPPPAEDRHDLKLSNAVTHMRESDYAINALYKKYGDDADSRADYQQAETDREAALEILATKRARTPRGMVAKAEALSERNLIGESQHGEIAVSLAADVLHHFGKRIAPTV